MREATQESTGPHRSLGALLLITALVCSACAEHGPPRSTYLIVVDTLRGDRVGAEWMPETARLSPIATRFANARTTSSWTLPSMGALFTSLYPRQLDLVETPDGRLEREGLPHRLQQAYAPSLGTTTVAERFRDAGFETVAFVDQPGLSSSPGFLQGFERRFVPVERRGIAELDAASELPEAAWHGMLRHAFAIDEALVAAFEAWVMEEVRKPRFAWIHLLTPHQPYAAALPGEEPMGPALARYDAEVRAVDRLVGRVLDAIDAAEGLSEVNVVFTSDHGEGFEEHGVSEHGNSLYGEVLRVPLWIASPELPRGSSVRQPVQTLDLAPTLLDLNGLPPIAAAEGRSLLPVVRSDDEARPLYSEGVLYGPSLRSIIHDGFKLIESPDGAQLFDLENDRHERNDLAAARPERVEAMRARLATWNERITPEREPEGQASLDDPERRATREALRALGYLE